MPEDPSCFAETLRGAIERRGLSLDRIQGHLQDRGVTISVATLSYWRSGRSEPARRSSLVALDHLEAVLRLPAGELRARLSTPRERARRPVQQLDSLWPEEPASAMLDRLDTRWDADLDRVTLHDLLRIGPDRRQVGLTVRQVLRARRDGPDRRVVMHCHDDPDADLPEIRVTSGARLGHVERSEDGVVGAELLFFAPLRRGQTVVVEYDVVPQGRRPLEGEYVRKLRTPMREYLLEVAFDPAALPHEVVAFTEDREAPIPLDPSHRGHLMHTDATPGTTGIRWTWSGTVNS